MKRHFYILIVLLLVVNGELFSQSFYDYKRDLKLSAIGGLGISGYYGDLNNPGDIIDLTGSFMLGAEYKFYQNFSARAHFNYVRVSGKDMDIDESVGTRVRNLSFKSDLLEFAALGVYNFTTNGRSYYLRPKFNAYAMAGVAATISNPKAEYDGETYKLRPIKTEGKDYGSVIIAVPAGLGANYSISNLINVGLEGLYRWTFTDYLDDVSTVYVDNSTFSDPIEALLADRRQELGLQPAEAGSIRGNPDKNDGYFTLMVVVQYYIPQLPYRKPGVKTKRNKQIQYKAPKPQKRRKRRL